MKQKEGRDWLELSESVFVIDDGRFRISDAGASIYMTHEDMKRVIEFVATHNIKEQPSPQPPQRKPLTLREIGAACGNFSNETIKVVRQTEAAHGIKENT